MLERGEMIFVGIDIGSTASKVVVRGDKTFRSILPTGWNSKETAEIIKKQLSAEDCHVEDKNVFVVATGYGRISVDYADEIITEISCHGKGGAFLARGDCTVLDIGGQDTKVIHVEKGNVTDFIMNEKCAAGTGKFIEIMANRLGVEINSLFELGQIGKPLPISSICTVFAESEIINYIGEGRKKEDIAAGVIHSVAEKVGLLCQRKEMKNKIILTGGLSGNQHFTNILAAKLKREVGSQQEGRYAGAIGAALFAEERCT